MSRNGVRFSMYNRNLMALFAAVALFTAPVLAYAGSYGLAYSGGLGFQAGPAYLGGGQPSYTVQINQTNLSDTYHTVQIGPTTPYSYVDGRKTFSLGTQPAVDFNSIVSPCTHGNAENAAYTPGIYNCQSSLSNGGAEIGAQESATTSVESTNWAGYASTSGSAVANAVQGSWVVQTANPTSSATYSAQWVGIGGYSDDTLIQTGTESDYYDGAAHYTAWYELLPASETAISGFTVNPGDSITANVQLIGTDEWEITLTDLTSNEAFTTTVTYESSELSAEWVEERPEICSRTCTLTTLSDFGTAYYGYDFTATPGTDFADMGSGLQQISALPGVADITMVSGSGKSSTLAQPSALSSDGTSSFTVAYGGAASTLEPTSTSVSCSPSSIKVGSTSACTATISGESAISGTVTFSASAGTFSGGACSDSGDTAACTITYTATAAGSQTVTASYSGGGSNAASVSSPTQVTVGQASSSTTVSCPSFAAGSTTTCTATVSGYSPTGKVTFTTSDGTGSFTGSPCTLSSGTCKVTYADSAAGSVTITAAYPGDANNEGSQGTASVTISTPSTTLAATTTAVSCSPDSFRAGSTTTCTATVKGTDPSGTVAFSSTSGSFSRESCSTRGDTETCTASYTDSASGTYTITAAYPGNKADAPSSGSTAVTVTAANSGHNGGPSNGH